MAARLRQQATLSVKQATKPALGRNACRQHTETLDLSDFAAKVSKDRLGTEPYDFSPVHRIKPRLPPTIIFHGKADTTVPYVTTEAFAAAMKKAGNRCELIGCEGQRHGFFNFDRADGRHYHENIGHRRQVPRVTRLFASPHGGAKGVDAQQIDRRSGRVPKPAIAEAIPIAHLGVKHWPFRGFHVRARGKSARRPAAIAT